MVFELCMLVDEASGANMDFVRVRPIFTITTTASILAGNSTSPGSFALSAGALPSYWQRALARLRCSCLPREATS